MSPRGDLPLNVSPFRRSELDETASRYDRLIAAPSDDELFFMWLFWGIVTAAVATFVMIVFLAVAFNPKVRRSPFNLYLLFLMVPDAFMSLACAVSCALNLSAGRYYSEAWCRFQGFYLIFGIGANAWLNAVIGREVHRMLRSSHRRQRYTPPRRRTVTLQAVTVYLWSGLLAALPLFDIPWIPHRIALQAGEACVPVEYSTASSVFFFCFFLPAFALIPVGYVIVVTADVLYRRLLPPGGKTRALAIYFFRLGVVFLVMWLPTLIVLFIAGGWLHPWVQWAGGLWSHLQGAVSAGFSMLKPDIWLAVKDFLTCRCGADENDASHGRWSAYGFSFRRRCKSSQSISTRRRSHLKKESNVTHDTVSMAETGDDVPKKEEGQESMNQESTNNESFSTTLSASFSYNEEQHQDQTKEQQTLPHNEEACSPSSQSSVPQRRGGLYGIDLDEEDDEESTGYSSDGFLAEEYEGDAGKTTSNVSKIDPTIQNLLRHNVRTPGTRISTGSSP